MKKYKYLKNKYLLTALVIFTTMVLLVSVYIFLKIYDLEKKVIAKSEVSFLKVESQLLRTKEPQKIIDNYNLDLLIKNKLSVSNLEYMSIEPSIGSGLDLKKNVSEIRFKFGLADEFEGFIGNHIIISKKKSLNLPEYDLVIVYSEQSFIENIIAFPFSRLFVLSLANTKIPLALSMYQAKIGENIFFSCFPSVEMLLVLLASSIFLTMLLFKNWYFIKKTKSLAVNLNSKEQDLVLLQTFSNNIFKLINTKIISINDALERLRQQHDEIVKSLKNNNLNINILLKYLTESCADLNVALFLRSFNNPKVELSLAKEINISLGCNAVLIYKKKIKISKNFSNKFVFQDKLKHVYILTSIIHLFVINLGPKEHIVIQEDNKDENNLILCFFDNSPMPWRKDTPNFDFDFPLAKDIFFNLAGVKALSTSDNINIKYQHNEKGNCVKIEYDLTFLTCSNVITGAFH